MGMTNYWEAIKKGKALPCNAPSSFRNLLEEAFGEFPVILCEKDHMLILKGLSIADKSNKEAWEDLIEAIEKRGCIRIWAE